MRTVNQLPVGIPRDTDLAKFPDSTVLNETETSEGTPVVREIYGDILTNVYKILRLAGITANNLEDSEVNGYQLVNALRKFTNTNNDVEQQLSLDGLVFSIPLNITLFPDKYFVIAKSVEDYVSTNVYTFKGSTPAPSYAFTSPTGFLSGDEVLLIIDQAGVRAFNISGITGGLTAAEVFTVFGTPLAYNDSIKMYYQSEGILFNDDPQSYDIQATLRSFVGDGTLLVYEMMIISGNLLCLTFVPGTLVYRLYKFSMSNLAAPSLITGTTFPSGVIADNFNPFMFFNGTNLLITNDSGNNADDNIIDIYTLNIGAGTVTVAGSITLDALYEKSTNSVFKGIYLYTFINGDIIQYNTNTGVRIYGKGFPTFIGNIFQFNGDVYYSNGEVGKKWALPIYT